MTSSQTQVQIEASIRSEIDNYSQTVQALKALANELCWREDSRRIDPAACYWLGRTMVTSASNRVSPNTSVTPDLLLQLSDGFGVIAEAKLALSRNGKYRLPRLKEIVKYDDDLTGWDTASGQIDLHDLIVLVHLSQAVDVGDDYVAMIKGGQITIGRKLAVIGFAIIEQAQTWLSLKLEHGELTRQDKAKKLRKMVNIGLDRIAALPRLASMQLYDAAPPPPYLMNLIHTTVLSSLTDQELIDLRDTTEVIKTVSATDLRAQPAEEHGPGIQGTRVPEIPRKSWVVDAMRRLQKMGWIRKADASYEHVEYIVKRRKKPLDQFISHCAAKQHADAEKQAAEDQARSIAPLLYEEIDSDDSGEPERND